MVYTFTRTERNNLKASDFETKSLLFLASNNTKYKNISFLTVDCFNDVSGICDKENIWDVQSKGEKNLTPRKIGCYLISLYENYISSFSGFFQEFLFFMPPVKIGYLNNSNIDSAISILSYPIPDCNDLNDPYDFSLMDYEFFPEEEGQRRKEILKKLHNTYRAELTHSLHSSDISLDIFFQGTKIGNVTVTPLIDDYKVKFKIKNSILITGPKKQFEEYLNVFNYPEIVKCWFESGHALVNGMVFKTGYRDVVYNKFIWADFGKYNILKEKPGANPNKPELDKIGKEKSLFCWVKNCWHGEWLDGKSFNTTFSPKGWLLCDDGAGEKADFIHYIQYQGIHLISLIHVKAAKSDSKSRKISVGAHDIVLNQGVKNLRSCERKNLSVDLEQRLNGLSNKKCWHDGIEQQPEEFINVLKTLTGQTSNVKTRVIIIQPHTTQKYYNNVSNSNVKRQLDVLLVSAESAIQSSGSEFHIFGYAN